MIHETQKGERIMSRLNNHRFLSGAIIAVAAIFLIALVGCSKSPTVSDEPSQPKLLKRTASAQKLLEGSAYVDTVLTAKEGGVVSLVDVHLSFPPGALPSDTLVFIEIADLSVFENHFGTDGLVFNLPVKVVMSYRDADLSGIVETSITLAWFNEYTGQWNRMPCVLDIFNKTVTGYVNHFSAYALISDDN